MPRPSLSERDERELALHQQLLPLLRQARSLAVEIDRIVRDARRAGTPAPRQELLNHANAYLSASEQRRRELIRRLPSVFDTG